MNKKKFALLVILISLCGFAVQADVAPDPGYTRVSSDLILDAREDFSGYRFFLQSPIDIEEISLKKGETIIDSANRGGAKRYATLVAVPHSAVPKFETSADELKWLNEQLRSKKMADVIELAKHSFQATILISQKPGWKNPVYRLEKDEQKGIKATLIQQQAEGGEVNFQLYSLEQSYTPLLLSLAIGGGLFSVAVLLLGIWFFRKKRHNASPGSL